MDAARSRIARCVGVMVALGAAAALGFPVAAAQLPSDTDPGLSVPATTFQVGDLMPGETLPTETITLSVIGNASYTIRSQTIGSSRLAQLLLIVISSQASGALIYRGPLAGAAVKGSLGAGSLPGTTTAETFTVRGQLPASAGNELQGDSLALEWLVQATEIARS